LRTKLLVDGEERLWAVVLATGEEVMSGLADWARAHAVTACGFSGIGAFSRATLGFFDPERRDYDRLEVDEQVEVLALTGNVALHDGEPKLHAHVVLGTRDGSARGGHLLAAHVRPTLELLVRASPAHLRRQHDEATGLPLLVP
jgi:predicted DNA-binding protein with PD1-like motif